MKGRRSFSRIVLIALPVVVVAGAAGARAFVSIREGLEQRQASIAADWAVVDGALQDRAGLIRDLAEALAAAGAGVTNMVQEVADANAELIRSAGPRERIRANDRLSTDLAKLLEAIDTKNRKGEARFSRLEDQIRDSEERIAVARRKYNEDLEHYNARIQRFPYNLVAKIQGFQRNDAYFHTEPF